MKKIILASLLAMPLAASAQSAFTIDNNGKKYSFPITSTITVTDNEISNLVEASAYKTDMKTIQLFGSATGYKFNNMQLVSDYVWAGKLMPAENKGFKFSASSKNNGDQYFGPANDATDLNVTAFGTASLGSTKFYNFEKGYEQDSVLVIFDERSAQFTIFGLKKAEVDDPATLTTLNFDSEKWTALIDSPEYGGKLLYGASGSGFSADETVYEWTDDDTQLHSKINEGSYGTAFWSGGVAVSNYHCDMDKGTFNTQLSIPTDLTAHSGSNFLIATGYNDGSTYGSDTRAIIDFKDGKARKIKGLWATNTSYFLNELNISGTATATTDTYVDAVFEGFDSNGKSTGTVKLRLQDGATPVMEWKYVDLSTLGKISKLKINYEASSDQYSTYGLSSPAYIAIDDIEIYK